MKVSLTFGFILLVIAFCIIHGLLYGYGRCSRCNRRKVLDVTGATRTVKGLLWSTRKEYELLCGHCGHREWREESDDYSPY